MTAKNKDEQEEALHSRELLYQIPQIHYHGQISVPADVRRKLRKIRDSTLKHNSRTTPPSPLTMHPSTHNKIVSFIWGIADDVLRDLFKRGN